MMSQTDTLRTAMPGAVTIGGRSRSGLLTLVREHDVRLNKAAETLFEDPRFTTRSGQEVVEIAVVSVAELGFGAGATYDQIVARALESGLVECPLELGPHLRIQFLAQPEGADAQPPIRGQAPPGSITVASAPLDDTDETPKGFYLRRVNGVSWLRGYWSWPGHVWNAEDVLVFAKRATT